MGMLDRDRYVRSESGLYIPEHCQKKRPIAMDLFSGAGGMSLGLIQGGFDVIAALEFNISAVHTYLCNLGAYPVKMVFIEEKDRKRTESYFSKHFNKSLKKKGVVTPDVSGANRHNISPEFEGVKYMFIGDIRKITGKQILDIMGLSVGDLDLVCGGPPCQGFSTAGKQNIMDPRNSLVLEFAKLIVEMKPKTMMFENVPGILNMTTPEGIPVMDAVAKILEDGEYGNYEALRKSILSTAGCGVAKRGTKGTLEEIREKHTAIDSHKASTITQQSLF